MFLNLTVIGGRENQGFCHKSTKALVKKRDNGEGDAKNDHKLRGIIIIIINIMIPIRTQHNFAAH